MQKSKSVNPIKKERIDFSKVQCANEEETLKILAEVICNIITTKMETYEEAHDNNGTT